MIKTNYYPAPSNSNFAVSQFADGSSYFDNYDVGTS